MIHTPGHAPGAVCFHAEDLGCLSTLPDDTVVHTGHGEDTTVGFERVGLG